MAKKHGLVCFESKTKNKSMHTTKISLKLSS